MIISRGVSICRTLLNKRKPLNLTQVANHGQYVYRSPPKLAPKSHEIAADIVGGVFWWWVLWHLWTEYEHITGEYPYPDSSKWTDEELGIPSDD